jgi:hypothetical protein
MTESNDPWKGLAPPAQMSSVSGRRVDPDLQWNLYWAVDTDNSCLLILQYHPENHPKGRLPKLRGLEVLNRTPDLDHYGLLVIRLRDSEQKEIFYRLCVDIISATRLATSEAEAIERFLARTWRWHRLLRGGREERLTDEEQKGLIGELCFMRQHLFPAIGPEASIKSWTGPLDAPKDFEVGRVCIEAKARRGAATPFINISTEHQLDTGGLDALFVNISEVTATSADDPNGTTVSDVARNVLAIVENQGATVVELYEERLHALGFDWTDDYSDKNWLIGPQHLFKVDGNFPRIIPGMYPNGVQNVRYSISIQDCEPYRTEHAYMKSLLPRVPHGNQH